MSLRSLSSTDSFQLDVEESQAVDDGLARDTEGEGFCTHRRKRQKHSEAWYQKGPEKLTDALAWPVNLIQSLAEHDALHGTHHISNLEAKFRRGVVLTVLRHGLR